MYDMARYIYIRLNIEMIKWENVTYKHVYMLLLLITDDMSLLAPPECILELCRCELYVDKIMNFAK